MSSIWYFIRAIAKATTTLRDTETRWKRTSVSRIFLWTERKSLDVSVRDRGNEWKKSTKKLVVHSNQYKHSFRVQRTTRILNTTKWQHFSMQKGSNTLKSIRWRWYTTQTHTHTSIHYDTYNDDDVVVQVHVPYQPAIHLIHNNLDNLATLTIQYTPWKWFVSEDPLSYNVSKTVTSKDLQMACVSHEFFAFPFDVKWQLTRR